MRCLCCAYPITSHLREPSMEVWWGELKSWVLHAIFFRLLRLTAPCLSTALKGQDLGKGSPCPSPPPLLLAVGLLAVGPTDASPFRSGGSRHRRRRHGQRILRRKSDTDADGRSLIGGRLQPPFRCRREDGKVCYGMVLYGGQSRLAGQHNESRHGYTERQPRISCGAANCDR